MSTHQNQIRDLLTTYERSLNTSDAHLAASCYSDDGVFMPTTLPTVTGADMADGYRRIFEAIRLDVTFTIDELVVTSDETAHALTRSNGTQTVLSTGDQSTESNRESSCSSEPTPTAGRSPVTCSTNPSSTPAATSGLKQRIGWIAGADLIFALNQEDAVEIANSGPSRTGT